MMHVCPCLQKEKHEQMAQADIMGRTAAMGSVEGRPLVKAKHRLV